MYTSFRRFVLITTFAGAVVFSVQAKAAEGVNRYGTWTDPTASPRASSQNLKGLLKDLNKLINEAEQARAADRLFLRDLKDLAARYENPWSERLFFDDFGDGDYIRNPQWSVKSGKYRVERGYGLRSEATQPSTAQNTAKTTKKLSKEEMILSIFGAVLNKNKKPKTPAAAPQSPPKPAMISARTRITNAFALNMEFSSWNAQGRFEIGVTQGTSGSGYRLAYSPGSNGAKSLLQLIKITSRGQGVIDQVSIAPLEDKRTHNLAWTRSIDGQMNINIDEIQAFTARDHSFRDAFSGLQLTNDGTDVIVKSIKILGTR